jgi:hypothetical protein
MFCVGSLMSQVLQCTQFCALICRRWASPPLASFGHELVHAGRAVAALGAGVLGQVDVHRHAGVLQRQVRRLVLFVVGVADEHAGEAVEGQLAIGLGVAMGLHSAAGFR